MDDSTKVHGVDDGADDPGVRSLSKTMDEDKERSFAQTFAEFIASLSRRKLRIRPRLETSIPVLLEMRGRIYSAQMTHISPLGLKLDQRFPITMRERCNLIIKTEPAVELMCVPIIGPQEFDTGSWDRLLIKTAFHFDILAAMVMVASK